MKTTVAPLSEGAPVAEEYLDILSLADAQVSPTRTMLRGLRKRTIDALSQAAPETADRWIWLAEHISQRHRMAPDA